MVVSWLRGLVLGVVLVLGAGPATAGAGVVGLGPDDDLLYTAATSEVNRLTVTLKGRTVVFRDAGAPVSIRPAVSCTQDSPKMVSCARANFLRVDLGDQDDAARVTGLVARGGIEVDGGLGDDRITGGSREEEIRGGAGNDRLAGGAASDELNGGAGDDHLRGGVGADLLYGGRGRDDLGGGRGRDDVMYLAPGDPRGEDDPSVTVTLDGLANDGARGERDWVRRDVEDVSIDHGRIVGNSGSNSLVGNGTLFGYAGEDWLSGHGRMYGGLGNDHLRSGGPLALGGPGDDEIDVNGAGRFDGGPGDDTLKKEEGYTTQSGDDLEAARLSGGSGADTISSRDIECDDSDDAATFCSDKDVKDRVSCGPGQDTVAASDSDIIARDCERVERGGS